MGLISRFLRAKFLLSTDDNRLQIQIFLSVTFLIAILNHIFLGIYFLFIRDLIHFTASISGVPLFTIAFFVNKAGKTRAASFMLIIVLLLMSTLACFIFGIEVGAHWMAILVLMLTASSYLDFTSIQKTYIILSMPIFMNLHLMAPTGFYAPARAETLAFLKFYYVNMIVSSIIVIHIGNTVIQQKFMELRTRDLEQTNVELEEKTYTDPLTGIYNRRYFDEKIEQIIRSASRTNVEFSLLMLDIDHFKKYNDTYGHLEGDNCLKIVADVIDKSINRTDDFVARYGGEEFVVVLQHTNEAGAVVVAEKIIKNIRNATIPHPRSVTAKHVTISIGGIACSNKHIQNSEELIKMADEMLYISKRDGRDMYTISKYAAIN
ncbi:MAG: GGDEF domain-containing protein [Oscillospiraceae bacterium]|nr:GGDEF domain-containing protein [Oscillospiraceae bacterium]